MDKPWRQECGNCGRLAQIRILMKPLTLTLALMASFCTMAQTVPVADSLAPDNADLQAKIDSAAHSDSLLRARVRVVSFPDAIDAVLGDLPNNLRLVTGVLILAEGEVDRYASLVLVPDAENCLVTRYHSRQDTTASWQAKMFSGANFNDASARYQQLYQQLKTCYVRLADGSVYYLQGTWEPAREGMKFTTSRFRLRANDWRYRYVEVELELVYQLADWAVNINIVTKRPDDEVGISGNR